MDLWELENVLYNQGYQVICGVDEAGRGPLAGPVCAAACVLPRGLAIEGLNDSKKLTEKRRETLFDIIREQAVTYGIAFATVEEIEEFNILGATFLALIDGNQTKGIEVSARAVVHGDAMCADIAAASVLAKVTRDRYMLGMAEQYPQYGFEKHKGYGTKAHYAAIREYGPSPIHRPSFLRKMN